MQETGEDPPTKPRRWHIDPKIWKAGPLKGRRQRATQRMREIFTSSSIWLVLVSAPFLTVGPIMVAYYLGGAVLFGPVLILVWSVMIVSFVLVTERTGYARNFETRHFKLSKSLVALFFAFALYLGLIYFLVTRTH